MDQQFGFTHLFRGRVGEDPGKEVVSYLVCASLGLGSRLYIFMSLRPKFGRGNDVRVM